MRFLADMGISMRTVEWLRQQGYDVTHLREEGLHRLSDEDILAKETSMLTALDIRSRTKILGGYSFGSARSYERLIGIASFGVDPKHPLNQMIADIDYAPVNRQGLVECSAEIEITAPVGRERGNGGLFYHVINRGNKGLLGTFNLAQRSNNPQTKEHYGDGFLMNRGYTLVYCGWQPDVPEGDDRMRCWVPIATDGGKTITGKVRSEIRIDELMYESSLGDRYHIPYEVFDTNEPEARLMVRKGPREIPELIPRDRWAFATLQDEKLVPSTTTIWLSTGFQPGLIYDLVYTAKNPLLVGLGLSMTRDLVSFLRYERETPQGQPNPLLDNNGAPAIMRTHAFGASQSGRFLRHFIYEGFNEDEKHRKVFDGVIPHIAGASLGDFNHRFAQPSRANGVHTGYFYPIEMFPFTDNPQVEPESGRKDGILVRAEKAGAAPKIFYTLTTAEYVNRSASLTHTNLDGTEDVPLPDNVRIYHFASTQHGPAAFPPGSEPPATSGKHLPNPVNNRFTLRALFLALDAWVADKTPPPPSQYAKISDGTLVKPTAEATGFPAIPNMTFPELIRQVTQHEYGPDLAQGIITEELIAYGKQYQALVSKVDADGNELRGLRLPEVAVPLATYTGWNQRHPDIGAEKALVGLLGSYVPFPKTKSERLAAGDPRPSIEERYKNREDYVARVREAAMQLAMEGYLLTEDLDRIAQQAAVHYDYLMKKD